MGVLLPLMRVDLTPISHVFGPMGNAHGTTPMGVGEVYVYLPQ